MTKSTPPSHPSSSGADDVDPHQQPASLAECRRCALWRHATQAVPGAGGAPAGLMLVGEQPGDKEDQAGLPFVGPAGQLLDAVLETAGVKRETVYVTNAVKHFKWELRGKRRMHKTPGQREVEACAYWLERELARVKPKVVVALGATALRAVLHDPHARLNTHMEQTTQVGGVAVIATWHPSYVLRAPEAEARARAREQMVDALRRAHALMARG